MATKVVKEKRAPRTPKEKAFVAEYAANGGNKVQAALKVYDTKNYKSATRIAHENTEKLRMVDYFDSIEGLKQKDRLFKLIEGLNSEQRDQFSGEITPDMKTRYKYLELTFKLDGSLKQAEVINNTQINISPILGGESNALHQDNSDQQSTEVNQEN